MEGQTQPEGGEGGRGSKKKWETAASQISRYAENQALRILQISVALR